MKYQQQRNLLQIDIAVDEEVSLYFQTTQNTSDTNFFALMTVHDEDYGKTTCRNQSRMRKSTDVFQADRMKIVINFKYEQNNPHQASKQSQVKVS